MAAAEFVHLHVHTAYSLLDGAIRVKDLLAQAQAYGMPAVAITDHGSLFGVLDFYQKAKAAGIKPLLGCELYVAAGLPPGKDRQGGQPPPGGPGAKPGGLPQPHPAGHPGPPGRVLLPAPGGQGAAAGVERRPHRPVLLPPRRGGASNSSTTTPEAAEASAREYAEIFPDRFYLEVQANNLPEQLKVNEALLELGAPLGSARGGHQRRALPEARRRPGPRRPVVHPDRQDREHLGPHEVPDGPALFQEPGGDGPDLPLPRGAGGLGGDCGPLRRLPGAGHLPFPGLPRHRRARAWSPS